MLAIGAPISLVARAFCAFAVLVLVRSEAAEPPVGMVDEPCPPPLVRSTELSELLVELFIEPRALAAVDLERLEKNPELAEINAEARRRTARDWPAICRYEAANAAILSGAAAPSVVFIGDSITENWVLADPGFFDGKIAGRGIGGQATPQMLLRFRADVVALGPRVVHILAGTNDVAGNTGPTSVQDFKNNIMSMVEIAKANGIDVILGAITPAAAFPWRPEVDPVARIGELNRWLRDYAARVNAAYIDYHAALAGRAGELRSDLSNDGVHPNRKGYAVMRHLVEDTLSERL